MEKRKINVAFICVHNACRSQIAEALGTHLAADVFDSYSAGTSIASHINSDALHWMKERFQIQMDQMQHPKLIDDLPMIDIVITMGCNVTCPTLPCSYREDWGIEDPTGKGEDVYQDVISLIYAKVVMLKERIENDLIELP